MHPRDSDTASRPAPVTRLLGGLLDRSHLALPDTLADVVAAAAGQVGWDVVVYLVDYDERELVPMSADGSAGDATHSVEGTLAGRCFRTVEPVVSNAPDLHVWVPLIDGVERLGVLRIRLPDGPDALDAPVIESVRWFAHLVAHLIASKSEYADAFHLVRQSAERSVASELIWSMLPPLTVACHGLVIAGSLAPTDAVAGDVFDYAIDRNVAHVAIADATGHDIGSAVIGALVLAAYRASRRRSADLVATAEHIDGVLSSFHAHSYATGVFCRLDLSSGTLHYLSAGHPAPLLVRNSRVVKSLEGGLRPLLGLGARDAPHAEQRLEPGDWVVFYTDGITEARDGGGRFFGIDRLVDIVERSAADQQPAAEALRHITQAVLTHQQGILQDDATMVVLQWRTGLEQRLTAHR